MTFTDDNQIWQPDQPTDNRQELQHLDQNPGAVIKQPVLTPKPLREATRKEKAFAQELIRNPGKTITQAYKAVYKHNGKETTAQVEASRTLSKPQVKLELAKYGAQAEQTLVEVLNYSKEYGRELNGSKEQGSAYAGVAVSVAKDILDRVHGKATQRIETRSEAVTLNIDLTSTTAEEAA